MSLKDINLHKEFSEIKWDRKRPEGLLPLSEKELQQIIVFARKEQWSVLDLSKCELESIPAEIGDLENLKELNLFKNKLKSILPELGKLQNLRRLSYFQNQLTSIPPELGMLQNLQELVLQSNKLVSLPQELGNLVNLRVFTVSGNELKSIPRRIGNLYNLKRLWLYNNQLTNIPVEIGELLNIELLDLNNNKLSKLPIELGRLQNLQKLDISANQLNSIPHELGQLQNLQELNISHNQLFSVPPELGNLTNLKDLRLEDNPLTSPPPEIVQQGTKAVLAFLQKLKEDQQQKTEVRQWVSKLVVVGEGGVGKSCLLKRLLGENYNPAEVAKTRAFEQSVLKRSHPQFKNETMRLNTWDFGGQKEYHATHQYFLTDQALVLLVWSCRLQYEQSKVTYWLDVIKARAPKAKVIIVGTHADIQYSGIPFADLEKNYSPMIVGGKCFYIENDPGKPIKGVEELDAAICEAAANMPQMGKPWPSKWLAAAEAVRKDTREYCTPIELEKTIRDQGLNAQEFEYVADELHIAGDIVWHRKEQALNELVLLKPHWVAQYIGAVLDDQEVAKLKGRLTHARMRELWHDLSPHLQHHFLRMMDRFDLSYQTEEDHQIISLVVDQLSYDPITDYLSLWNRLVPSDQIKEIRMRFRIDAHFPPGIPTYFIARFHRHATEHVWRRGALFEETHEQHRLGLIESKPDNERYLTLYVRGPLPYHFFNVLRYGFENSLSLLSEEFRNNIRRTIPCDGVKCDSAPCDYEFIFENLERRLTMKPPRNEIECPTCLKVHAVTELLFGISSTTLEQVQEDLRNHREEENERHKALTNTLKFWYNEWVQREQSRLEVQCPTTFMLDYADASCRDGDLSLHLYCQAPDKWHETPDTGKGGKDNGKYKIKRTNPNLLAVAPYWNRLRSIFGIGIPLAQLGIALFAPNAASVGDVAGKAKDAVEAIPRISKTHAEELTEVVGELEWHERVKGPASRALYDLLCELDDRKIWGGLHEINTKEHGPLWLCEECAKKYQHRGWNDLQNIS